MAITLRRTHAPTPERVPTDPELPTLSSSFDQTELVAVAEYLAQNAEAGNAAWNVCAQELCDWADADRAALTVAAATTTLGLRTAAATMLRDAASLATH